MTWERSAKGSSPSVLFLLRVLLWSVVKSISLSIVLDHTTYPKKKWLACFLNFWRKKKKKENGRRPWWEWRPPICLFQRLTALLCRRMDCEGSKMRISSRKRPEASMLNGIIDSYNVLARISRTRYGVYKSERTWSAGQGLVDWRKQCSACPISCNNMWRYTWPVLWSSGAVQGLTSSKSSFFSFVIFRAGGGGSSVNELHIYGTQLNHRFGKILVT